MRQIDFLRAFVRPFSAYLLLLVLSAITLWGFIRFADLELYKIVLLAFLEIVSFVVGFWFGSRQTKSGESQ